MLKLWIGKDLFSEDDTCLEIADIPMEKIIELIKTHVELGFEVAIVNRN